MRQHIRRSLAVVSASAAAVLALGASPSSAAVHANLYEGYAAGSVSYDPANDVVKVKDRKKDGRSFGVVVFGPATEGRGGHCLVGGKGKTRTCDFNFGSGRVNFEVYTKRGGNHWVVDRFQTRT
ncbi:hypothetical protein [Streptomyces spectabilis]|uniref:Uncharacterized protein n=1 Tax=Streptomyces spectabilis TaxID=68270 RepID=A0A5P2XGC3_STRST|nr:hypothetical protein [Streptomyces spectabilis]MBB5108182.1 hypothetical protein [Streptomyces spectabilis]MCI3904404.1 hypothetical protein [Streptomyces spectabilis]QEV61502.1 hypothetical protein CP982_24675 [Streptomyces spectabilis]GGV26988.1 hypothetical protein GCM10010245_44380 [Streptomyces spectabilis]